MGNRYATALFRKPPVQLRPELADGRRLRRAHLGIDAGRGSGRDARRTHLVRRLDDEGFLYIVDRAKDIIIRGGENISSLEVESVLIEHSDVLDVAVFATPHATLGKEVGAVVRLPPGSAITAEDLRAHAAASLATHKVPVHIWLTIEPFPRGDTGKTLKRVMQAEYVSQVVAS